MSGLKIGDKLMQIDHKITESQSDIKEYLLKSRLKEAQLLFDRNDFQFL